MTGNGKAIAQAIFLGGSLVASAVAIGTAFYWGGALAEGQDNHEEKACHEDACERLNMVETELSGLKATVRETGRATEKQIEDLKTEQRLRFDNLERILRQQN